MNKRKGSDNHILKYKNRDMKMTILFKNTKTKKCNCKNERKINNSSLAAN